MQYKTGKRKGRKLPTVLSYDEFLKVLNKVKKKNSHYKLSFKLGFLCGLRVSEIVKLQPQDVDYGRGLLFISQGKGKKDRYVPFPKKMNIELRRGLPIGCGIRALEKAFKKVVSQTDITKDVHFHTLRHSCATFYLDKGMDISYVQRLLGHSNISTTMIYIHTSPEKVKEKMEEIWQ